MTGDRDKDEDRTAAADDGDTNEGRNGASFGEAVAAAEDVGPEEEKDEADDVDRKDEGAEGEGDAASVEPLPPAAAAATGFSMTSSRADKGAHFSLGKSTSTVATTTAATCTSFNSLGPKDPMCMGVGIGEGEGRIAQEGA